MTIRIQDKVASREIDKKAKRGSLQKGAGAGSSPFIRTLAQQEAGFADYEQELQYLKDEIDRAGDDLEKEPTMANFRAFRDLIAAVTKKVTSHAYKLEKVGGTTLNPRCFEIITVIDREADNLYRLIMSEQKDRLAITNKIMELKGLVVNFHL